MLLCDECYKKGICKDEKRCRYLSNLENELNDNDDSSVSIEVKCRSFMNEDEFNFDALKYWRHISELEAIK